MCHESHRPVLKTRRTLANRAFRGPAGYRALSLLRLVRHGYLGEYQRIASLPVWSLTASREDALQAAGVIQIYAKAKKLNEIVREGHWDHQHCGNTTLVKRKLSVYIGEVGRVRLTLTNPIQLRSVEVDAADEPDAMDSVGERSVCGLLLDEHREKRLKGEVDLEVFVKDIAVVRSGESNWLETMIAGWTPATAGWQEGKHCLFCSATMVTAEPTGSQPLDFAAQVLSLLDVALNALVFSSTIFLKQWLNLRLKLPRMRLGVEIERRSLPSKD
ncbi:hypothetical protein DFH06DRAFT_1391204 [Mycena polygramma]|nr:hypothetical protein DFH06DRAFT_1391204 [Mycena polygramma]